LTGAKTFEIPPEIWARMSPQERRAANQAFLDDVIQSGNDVLLATRVDEAFPGSVYEWELDYMLDHGYTVSPDHWRLQAP
jgi:hypothetical protein